MKLLLALSAAALLAFQGHAASAQPAPAKAAPAASAAPSDALVERFLAALPDREEIMAASSEIDAGELSRLVALNPGKEAPLRKILQSNLACTGPAVTAGTLRMLRTIARDLGTEKLQKLIAFYEGPAYAEFKALAPRMEGNSAPGAADKAALDKLLATYPLQDFLERMNRAGEIIAADQGFMASAMKCAQEQVDALTAAGLKAN